MVKSVIVRDSPVPEALVVLRMGSNTGSDNALTQACERAHAAMGLHSFSVFDGVRARGRRLRVAAHGPVSAVVGRALGADRGAVRPAAVALPWSDREPDLDRTALAWWP
jgi:hypothetical protein